MKYADEPMKFLENEVDLLSLIRGLAQVGLGKRGVRSFVSHSYERCSGRAGWMAAANP
jgi:hypothetical protein